MHKLATSTMALEPKAWGLPFLFFAASFSVKGVQKLFSFHEFYDFHKNNDHCWVSVPCNENLPKQEKNDLGVKP